MRGLSWVLRLAPAVLVGSAYLGGCNISPVEFADEDKPVGGGEASGGSKGDSGGTTSSGGASAAGGVSSGGAGASSGGAGASSGGAGGCAAMSGGCECEKGDKQRCEESGAKGACAEGEQVCTEEGVFGDCSIQPATADDCSIPQNDADCDGTPNSGCPCVTGDTQKCGPTTDAGECEYGTSTCSDSKYGECEGAIDRAPRDCTSAQDNDCDGKADNTLDDECECEPGKTQACDTHPGFDSVGPCRPGSQKCELSEDGTRSYWGSCAGAVGPASQDTCDPNDNSDCTGGPNTGCDCVAGRTETCATVYGSKGVCASVSLTCTTAGQWPGSGACMAPLKAEDCRTALDENCDGNVNEAASCPCQSAPCQHGGVCNPGSGTAYTCDCTGTGYGGTLCEKPRAQVISGPTGASSCEVYGISDNGTVVAAQCEVGATYTQAYFWTSSGGWKKAPVPSGYPEAYLVGLSSDGTMAAGSLRNPNHTDYASKWTSLTANAAVLPDSTWRAAQGFSANGSVVLGIETNSDVWAWVGSNSPQNYGTGNAAVSGDGKIIFSVSTNGFKIWTSPTTSPEYSLKGPLVPVSVSFDGSTMIGYFPSDSAGIVKYRNNGISPLNSATTCMPNTVSGDGRYVLGLCPTGLHLWYDATPTRVQDLLAATGSAVTLKTDVNGRLSSNANYVALPHGTGVVIVQLN